MVTATPRQAPCELLENGVRSWPLSRIRFIHLNKGLALRKSVSATATQASCRETKKPKTRRFLSRVLFPSRTKFWSHPFSTLFSLDKTSSAAPPYLFY